MRVAVLHGGTSTEHDVSVASGQGVLAALNRLGHDPVPILVDRAGEWHTPTASGRLHALTTLLTCDVVVPALHGAGGEDGTVQGLLELLGLPYVGSGVRASAVCLDKGLTKALVLRLQLGLMALHQLRGHLVPHAAKQRIGQGGRDDRREPEEQDRVVPDADQPQGQEHPEEDEQPENAVTDHGHIPE